jgi:hypothetical protein
VRGLAKIKPSLQSSKILNKNKEQKKRTKTQNTKHKTQNTKQVASPFSCPPSQKQQQNQAESANKHKRGYHRKIRKRRSHNSVEFLRYKKPKEDQKINR